MESSSYFRIRISRKHNHQNDPQRIPKWWRNIETILNSHGGIADLMVPQLEKSEVGQDVAPDAVNVHLRSFKWNKHPFVVTIKNTHPNGDDKDPCRSGSFGNIKWDAWEWVPKIGGIENALNEEQFSAHGLTAREDLSTGVHSWRFEQIKSQDENKYCGYSAKVISYKCESKRGHGGGFNTFYDIILEHVTISRRLKFEKWRSQVAEKIWGDNSWFGSPTKNSSQSPVSSKRQEEVVGDTSGSSEASESTRTKRKWERIKQRTLDYVRKTRDYHQNAKNDEHENIETIRKRV